MIILRDLKYMEFWHWYKKTLYLGLIKCVADLKDYQFPKLLFQALSVANDLNLHLVLALLLEHLGDVAWHLTPNWDLQKEKAYEVLTTSWVRKHWFFCR